MENEVLELDPVFSEVQLRQTNAQSSLVPTENVGSAPITSISSGSSGIGASVIGGVATLVSPLTTKGDLFTRSSTVGTRLPVGTNGQAPVANSAETTGLKYQTIEQLLSSTTVNLNSAANQDLYTNSSGKTLIVTDVKARAASVDISAYASDVAIKENASGDAVIDSFTAAQWALLTDANHFIPSPGFAGTNAPYRKVANGEKVIARPTGAFGSAATVVFDLWGYFV